MRQDFTNQTVLKMPKIVHTNLVYFETFCQVLSYCFDAFSDTFAELNKSGRQCRFHIFSLRSDNKNFVTLQQKRIPIRINLPVHHSSKVSIL